jgi:RimJ/RimL family protein N-acetyltransferase
LNLEDFRLMLDGMDRMEHALGLKSSGLFLDENTQKAMEGLYKQALDNRDKYQWYTNWQIILKDENVSVGSACFKGAPGITGEVEIGYGLNDNYRGKGYMAEAIKAIVIWALEQEGVFRVVAETDKDNIASQKVLWRSGFYRYKEEGESLFWCRTKLPD